MMQSRVRIWEKPSRGIIELVPLLGNGNKHSGKTTLNAKLDCGFVARKSRKHFLQLQRSLCTRPVVVVVVVVVAAAVVVVAAAVVVVAAAVVMVVVAAVVMVVGWWWRRQR